MELYHGSIVYSPSAEKLAEHTDSYLAVEGGVVEGIYPTVPESLRGAPVTELGQNVLIPAFSDLHVHAPQYPQRGLAMDELLPDWLAHHTFPLEARFADLDFARAVYDAFADDLIAHGAASMHPEDRELWFNTFCRENQLKPYQEGKKDFHLVTRQIGDAGIYRKVETGNYFVKSPATEDVLVISLCNNIAEE